MSGLSSTLIKCAKEEMKKRAHTEMVLIEDVVRVIPDNRILSVFFNNKDILKHFHSDGKGSSRVIGGVYFTDVCKFIDKL